MLISATQSWKARFPAGGPETTASWPLLRSDSGRGAPCRHRIRYVARAPEAALYVKPVVDHQVHFPETNPQTRRRARLSPGYGRLAPLLNQIEIARVEIGELDQTGPVLDLNRASSPFQQSISADRLQRSIDVHQARADHLS
jgi:hypothetical protein